MVHLWTLDGQPVPSFMNIHKNCRVLIASSNSKFDGLLGLDEFMGELRPALDTDSVKPLS